MGATLGRVGKPSDSEKRGGQRDLGARTLGYVSSITVGFDRGKSWFQL